MDVHRLALLELDHVVASSRNAFSLEWFAGHTRAKEERSIIGGNLDT